MAGARGSLAGEGGGAEAGPAIDSVSASSEYGVDGYCRIEARYDAGKFIGSGAAIDYYNCSGSQGPPFDYVMYGSFGERDRATRVRAG